MLSAFDDPPTAGDRGREGEGKIHVLDPLFGLGIVGVCVGVKVEVAVTVIRVGVAVTMSVKVVVGLLLRSRSSLRLARSIPPSIS